MPLALNYSVKLHALALKKAKFHYTKAKFEKKT